MRAHEVLRSRGGGGMGETTSFCGVAAVAV